VNARIQVEHPVTALLMVWTWCRNSFAFAAGLPLSLKRMRLVHGAAIECLASGGRSRDRFLCVWYFYGMKEPRSGNTHVGAAYLWLAGGHAITIPSSRSWCLGPPGSHTARSRSHETCWQEYQLLECVPLCPCPWLMEHSPFHSCDFRTDLLPTSGMGEGRVGSIC